MTADVQGAEERGEIAVCHIELQRHLAAVDLLLQPADGIRESVDAALAGRSAVCLSALGVRRSISMLTTTAMARAPAVTFRNLRGIFIWRVPGTTQ